MTPSPTVERSSTSPGRATARASQSPAPRRPPTLSCFAVCEDALRPR